MGASVITYWNAGRFSDNIHVVTFRDNKAAHVYV